MHYNRIILHKPKATVVNIIRSARPKLSKPSRRGLKYDVSISCRGVSPPKKDYFFGEVLHLGITQTISDHEDTFLGF